MNKFFGIGLIALALAIAVIPQFNNCSYDGKFVKTASGGTVPMKCHWTAQAELPIGVGLLAVGAIMTTSKRRESLRSMGIMGIVLGATAIALPTNLIGVCAMGSHCETIMKPSMIGLGSLAMVGSAVGIVMAQMKKGIDI